MRIRVYKSMMFLLLSTFFVSGCLPEPGVEGEAQAPSFSGFNGASFAVGTSSSTIQVSWNGPNQEQDIAAFQVYQVDLDFNLVQLAVVGKNEISYAHEGLVSGSSHRYIVRAVYSTGVPDTNLRLVSAITQNGGGGGGPSGLVLSPSSKTLQFNKLFSFATAGGVPPYTYTLLSGPGGVDSNTGEFFSTSHPRHGDH